MPLTRFSLSSLRYRSAQALNLLHRYGSSKGFHSSSYVKSARTKSSFPLLSDKMPTPRSWKPYIIPAALVGGIGGVLFLVHKNDERRAIPKGQEAKCECKNVEGPIIGGPFSLINTEGQLVTQRNLLGGWTVLYFSYTSSPDVGPAEVQKLAKTINILGKKQNIKVKPVFVTLDPQRDTPSQLRAYLKEFDSRIMGLTGPVAAIRQMAQEYRVFFKKVEEDGDDYLIESSHNMYLLNPKLEVVKCFGVEYNAEELSDAILAEMKKTY